MSCPSTTTCFAVGTYVDGSGTGVSLAERWNGTSWSRLATPNPPGAPVSILNGGGKVRREHLDAYLNEFTFRFNRRSSRRRGLLFYRLLQQAILSDPITYRSLIVNGRPTGRRATPPARPGRVAPVSAVHRPWRQTQQPELNG